LVFIELKARAGKFSARFCMENFVFNEEVKSALHHAEPIVALESTVIAHGLPYPKNLETAYKLEKIVRASGAVPATMAVFGGVFYAGLDAEKIERLAAGENIRKISRRDLALAVAGKWDCATTVATTMWMAHRAGIKIFATGGIGGVHRDFSGGFSANISADVSADLPELAQTPMTVVSSGAKIILDLPATREWLETHGVTVLGYGCDEFPAFYSRRSQMGGLPVDERVETAEEVAKIIRARDELKLPGAILLTVPVPAENEIPRDELEVILREVLSAAEERGIKGKNLTPFLLSQMSERSGGKTLEANIALLKNNAKVAAQVAVAAVALGAPMDL
jgi:pseudouridine-5'-phosphate glycosidase